MGWIKTKNWKYPTVTHLYADTLDELHAFAKRLGLRREWFQNRKNLPHYDLNSSRRKVAVSLGAIETTRKHLVEYMNINQSNVPPNH